MDAFTLKKILSLATQLVPGALLLIALGLLWRRLRAVAWVALLGLLLLASPPSSNALVSSLERRHPPLAAAPPQTAVIAVLGYGHAPQPPRAASNTLLAGALARLAEAVRLWRSQPGALLVLSGGHLWGDSGPSHAAVLAGAAQELGVPAERIRRIEGGRDTAEEARLIAAWADDGAVVVVSSATHLPRARALFAAAGVAITPAPADYLASPAPWWRLSSRHLDNSERAIHEYVGTAWSQLRALLD